MIPKKIIDNSDVKLSAFLNSVLEEIPQTQFDIATAFFNIQAYSLVKENIQNIKRFRLLLGKAPEIRNEMTLGDVLLRLIKEEREGFDLSKEKDNLVKEFIEFLNKDNVEVRLYDKEFLHWKAYIFDQLVVVGSSNFTPSGLTHNTELNSVSLEAEAQYVRANWFDKFWNEAGRARIEQWGIEEEFLKPVIKSPRECKSILIKPEDLKYKVFMCHKNKKELKGTNALKYIEWGEKQGFHERPSCSGRRRWWDLRVWEYADSFWMESINDINRVYINNSKLLENDKFYGITFRSRENCEYYSLLLNGTLYCLFRELKGFAGMGEGVLKLPVYDVKDIYFIVPSKKINIEINRDVVSIFTELGINPSLPIRERKPNSLPDRKALDDIVFDILGLTKEERKEVYWAVCELVKNRLDKARNV